MLKNFQGIKNQNNLFAENAWNLLKTITLRTLNLIEMHQSVIKYSTKNNYHKIVIKTSKNWIYRNIMQLNNSQRLYDIYSDDDRKQKNHYACWKDKLISFLLN